MINEKWINAQIRNVQMSYFMKILIKPKEKIRELDPKFWDLLAAESFSLVQMHKIIYCI